MQAQLTTNAHFHLLTTTGFKSKTCSWKHCFAVHYYLTQTLFPITVHSKAPEQVGFQSSCKTKDSLYRRADTQIFQTFSIWVRFFLYAYRDHLFPFDCIISKTNDKEYKMRNFIYLFPLTLAISVLSAHITLSILSQKCLNYYSFY